MRQTPLKSKRLSELLLQRAFSKQQNSLRQRIIKNEQNEPIIRPSSQITSNRQISIETTPNYQNLTQCRTIKHTNKLQTVHQTPKRDENNDDELIKKKKERDRDRIYHQKNHCCRFRHRLRERHPRKTGERSGRASCGQRRKYCHREASVHRKKNHWQYLCP